MSGSAFRPMPTFTGKERLKLFCRDQLIGIITKLDSDWPLMMGQIELTPAAEPYKGIWEFWTSEDNYGKDPPFEIPADLEENWFVEDENGKRTLIDFPAVHSDGEVRYREF